MWKKSSGFRGQTILPIIHHQPTHDSYALQFIQASPTLAQEWLVHYRGPATTKRVEWEMSSKSCPKVGILQGTFPFILSDFCHRFLHVDDTRRFFLLFSPICTKNLTKSSRGWWLVHLPHNHTIETKNPSLWPAIFLEQIFITLHQKDLDFTKFNVNSVNFARILKPQNWKRKRNCLWHLSDFHDCNQIE
jgi:hypothetical protein